MMAVMETIKPEVMHRIISEFFRKNLFKRKAIHLEAFFANWLLAHDKTPSDGKGAC